MPPRISRLSKCTCPASRFGYTCTAITLPSNNGVIVGTIVWPTRMRFAPNCASARSTSASVADLYARGASDRLGVLWDTLHTHRHGESADETWAALGPRIRHVHVKDSYKADRNGFVFALTGEGSVPVRSFLQQALAARKGIDDLSALETRLAIMEWMGRLDMDPSFADRYLNEGFSGGEKKRNEILQMALLNPSLAILDETDSGLDIDALRVVAAGVNQLRSSERAIVVVTHYQRLLNHIVPDYVHVLLDGRIVKSGGKELAHELEAKGYEWLEQEVGAVS